MTDSRKYDICYGYINKKHKVDFVILSFILSPKNNIKIIDIVFPKIVTKVETTLTEIKKVLPNSINGVTPVNTEEAINMTTEEKIKEY